MVQTITKYLHLLRFRLMEMKHNGITCILSHILSEYAFHMHIQLTNISIHKCSIKPTHTRVSFHADSCRMFTPLETRYQPKKPAHVTDRQQ